MISSIWSSVKLKFTRVDTRITFPEKIDGYYFVKELEKIGPKKSFKLALFRNKSGSKAIAKMASSKIRGYHYFSLINEAKIYEILNSVYKRVEHQLPEDIRNIHIPKLINVIETNNSVVLLIEFIEADELESSPDSIKVKTYFCITKFLDFLGKRLTAEEKSYLSKRTLIDLAIIYPMLAFISGYNFPRAIPEIVRGTLVLLRSFYTVSKHWKEGLVHRDLHFHNILLKDSNVYLIDLQQCLFTEPLHEYVTTLRYYWKDGNFYKDFIKQIYVQFENDKEFYTVFRGLLINSVTHGLIDKAFSGQISILWLDLLNEVNSCQRKDFLEKCLSH